MTCIRSVIESLVDRRKSQFGRFYGNAYEVPGIGFNGVLHAGQYERNPEAS